jgi:hypothetical protein
MMEEKLSTSDFLPTGERRAGDARPGDTTASASGGGARMVREPVQDAAAETPLFPDVECRDFRSRWDNIQIGFVDKPRHAVEEADNLVAQTMKRLAEIFADERKKLEEQWAQGDDVSTEDLRVALQRYRSFFNRLLTM